MFFVLKQTALSPAANMAWDDALLESIAVLGRPVLRLYSWSEPAATFGYSQHIADIEKLTALRPLIRRPTGGGLVPHDADWTYSLTVPPAHDWYSLRATESYRRMHEWIQSAFDAIRVPAELSLLRRIEASGQCFVGNEQFDLLVEGRKLAGAAQRRTRGGLLIQGSIQPPAGADRAAFESELLKKAADWLQASSSDAAGPTQSTGALWINLPPSADLIRHVAELAREKYSSVEFNRRR